MKKNHFVVLQIILMFFGDRRNACNMAMNAAAAAADKALGHNPISTGTAEPFKSSTKFMHAIVWRGKQDM